MSREEIEEKVIKIIQDEKKEVIQKENFEYLNLTYDLALTSLEIVEIIMQCESEFNVEFTDKEIMMTDTVEKIIERIKNKTDYAKQ